MRELTLPAPVMLLPGLGADAELFHHQRSAFGEAVTTPDWIDPSDPSESLASYAERWAQAINAEVATYRTDRPWFLGGMSMGGMLALEMVPHLERKPAAVFLIASCRNTPALPLLIKIGAAVTDKVPAKQVATGVKLGAVPFAFRDGQDDDGHKLLVRMAKAADPDQLKWAIGATAEWTYAGPPETLPSGEPFPPIFQIHGRHDWLIGLQEDDCDLVIDKGRHLINLSHPKTLNRWLYDHVTALCGIDESNEPRVEDPDLTVLRRPELASRF